MYKIGEIIKGVVTGIEKYGVFVKIDDEYNGLIHISEVSETFVYNIHEYVSMGETIYIQVLEIDEKTKRMKLSIKDINYKEIPVNKYVIETRKGFLPLKENLDNWIKEKLDYYNYKENNM